MSYLQCYTNNMVIKEQLDKSSIKPGRSMEDLHHFLSEYAHTKEYEVKTEKKCCRRQGLQNVVSLPGEDTAEATRLRILSELKLKELLTRKRHNGGDACYAGTKLV